MKSKPLNENAAAWVAALRSGDYKQCQGALEISDHAGNPIGNCCLGVACRIFAKSNSLSISCTPNAATKFGGSVAMLPIQVGDWLGLRDIGGEYDGGELHVLNDAKGYTFSQIADLIESKPKGLFQP